MTPTSSTTTDDANGTPETGAPLTDVTSPDGTSADGTSPDGTSADGTSADGTSAESESADTTAAADLDDDDAEDDELEEGEPIDEVLAVARPVGPSRLRRTVSALVATVVFEILYLAGVTAIAFVSAGVVAIVPTLQSVAISPFAWVPATVFLVCALIVALPLNGARRAPAITGLIVAVVVYLGATLFVLLVAAGTSALGVFVQELGVYPFFLAAIVAREVMVWTRFGHRRAPRTEVVVAS